jgi:hypothetical protein
MAACESLKVFGFLCAASVLWGGEPAQPPPLDPAVAVLAAEVHAKGWIAFGARSNQGDWDCSSAARTARTCAP